MTEIRDAAWHEREYNPRLTVPETADLLADWPRRAAATRARRPFQADIVYGDHPRDRIDLFRAEEPRGTLVFIHGGYWRAFSKIETAWIADGFVDRGVSVALVGYPLCPDVTVGAIAVHVRAAVAHLLAAVLTDAERAAVVVAGHSAGGYLAADLVATDWTAVGLPAAPFAGALPISGLFDLAPLIATSMNADIRLTPETAAAWSLGPRPPATRCPLVLAVGGDEPGAFQRQSRDLAAAWSDLAPTVEAIPGANHFTVLDSLADPCGRLNRLVFDRIEAGRRP